MQRGKKTQVAERFQFFQYMIYERRRSLLTRTFFSETYPIFHYSSCATLRGHLSKTWARFYIVLYVYRPKLSCVRARTILFSISGLEAVKINATF